MFGAATLWCSGLGRAFKPVTAYKSYSAFSIKTLPNASAKIAGQQ